MTLNKLIYETAAKDLGTWEWAGSDHNPKVLNYYVESGFPEIKTDEVPWCAAFVGSVLYRCGIKPTQSLLARSYSKFGEAVSSLSAAKQGDIVVLSRGKSWQGHVGFFSEVRGSRIYLLGGNQGNQVNLSSYDVKRIVAIRRAVPTPTAFKQPRDNLASSTTVQATGVGAAGTVAAIGTGIGQLDGTAQIAVIVAGVVVLLALAWIARERIKKWSRGDR